MNEPTQTPAIPNWFPWPENVPVETTELGVHGKIIDGRLWLSFDGGETWFNNDSLDKH